MGELKAGGIICGNADLGKRESRCVALLFWTGELRWQFFQEWPWSYGAAGDGLVRTAASCLSGNVFTMPSVDQAVPM